MKITKYLWILLFIIAFGGLFYPKLGLLVGLIMVTLMIISIFKGRWFCGNLCPRGSFLDNLLAKVSRRRKIPKIFSSKALRYIILAGMLGFMVFRLISIEFVVEKIAFLFVMMCLVTTLIAILFGAWFSERTWCTFCPMGTLQMMIGGGKDPIKVNSSCVDCGICERVCPMQIDYTSKECIFCMKCVEACPKKALS